MRSLEVVKDKRDKLEEKWMRYYKLQEGEYKKPKNLEEWDKQKRNEYMYICEEMDRLKIQINTLEFVLNEDTELGENIIKNRYYSRQGVDVEGIQRRIEG